MTESAPEVPHSILSPSLKSEEELRERTRTLQTSIAWNEFYERKDLQARIFKPFLRLLLLALIVVEGEKQPRKTGRTNTLDNSTTESRLSSVLHHQLFCLLDPTFSGTSADISGTMRNMGCYITDQFLDKKVAGIVLSERRAFCRYMKHEGERFDTLLGELITVVKEARKHVVREVREKKSPPQREKRNYSGNYRSQNGPVDKRSLRIVEQKNTKVAFTIAKNIDENFEALSGNPDFALSPDIQISRAHFYSNIEGDEQLLPGVHIHITLRGKEPGAELATPLSNYLIQLRQITDARSKGLLYTTSEWGEKLAGILSKQYALPVPFIIDVAMIKSGWVSAGTSQLAEKFRLRVVHDETRVARRATLVGVSD